MLKMKIIQKITPESRSLALFKDIKDITIANRYIKIVNKTNIKQVFPIIYNFNSITIYEYPKEYSNKPFYIVNKKESYSYNDLMDQLSHLI